MHQLLPEYRLQGRSAGFYRLSSFFRERIVVWRIPRFGTQYPIDPTLNVCPGFHSMYSCSRASSVFDPSVCQIHSFKKTGFFALALLIQYYLKGFFRRCKHVIASDLISGTESTIYFPQGFLLLIHVSLSFRSGS